MMTTGYLELFGIHCVYIEDEEGLVIVPKDKSRMPELAKHVFDTGFSVQFEEMSDNNCTAFIERMEFIGDSAYRLVPSYIIKAINENPFSFFEMKGDAIDDFFRPARYFYCRAKAGNRDFGNLIYGNEIADSWSITFEEKQVQITLSYGDILRHGTASDLMLHPQLKVEFPETTNLPFIYRLHTVIIRFLQFVRYEVNCGNIRTKLYGKPSGELFNVGRIIDKHSRQPKFNAYIGEADYTSYRQYMGGILQFAANNPKLYMHHFPKEAQRYFPWDYSPLVFTSLFGAFESECHADKKNYECVDDSGIVALRTQMLKQLKQVQINKDNPEEKQFLDNACGRLSQLGTQFGQKKKIAHAFEVLSPALNSSIENIFIFPEMRYKAPLTSEQIDTIAGAIAALRGTIVHGDFSGEFTEVQGKLLRFFEILIYAQMLKRACVDYEGIELIVGAVFHCNHVLINKIIRG